MKTILVTGSNGLLGQKLVHALLGKNDVTLIAVSKGPNRIAVRDGYLYEDLDITDGERLKSVFEKYQPHCVINTAAMTNVDACETKRKECWDVNVNSVQNMVKILQDPLYRVEGNAPHFIHLSTDFVFDGEEGPYNEGDKPNPLSYYACSKYEAEKIVIQSSLRWAILRTIIVYGIVDDMSRSNVVLWAKDALSQGKKINVVDDQYRMPTLAEDLAQACVFAALIEAEGIFHVSGKDYMSILELVQRVADFWHLDKTLISPVKSSELHQPAKRPPRTGFVLDKAVRILNYSPHSFEEGLHILDSQLKNRG